MSRYSSLHLEKFTCHQ